MTALPTRRGISLEVPGVEINATGLVVTDPYISYEAYEAIGVALGGMRDSMTWALGDWLANSEALFGEASGQLVEATGLAKATLLEYQRVARRVLRAQRRPDVSWSHHQTVAAREPEQQATWLERAATRGWSVEELRGAMRVEPAYTSRPDRSRARVEVLEHVEDVARALLRAAEPLGQGYTRIPDHVLHRLANALGERA